MQHDKKYYRDLILNTDILNKANKDTEIFTKVINDENFIAAKSIFIYISTKKEVDTTKIIDYALKNNKIVCVPIIQGNNMIIGEININTKYEIGSYNILSPIYYNIPKYIPEIAFIPMVGYHGNERLGMGGGYYDKWLEKNEIFKIGLSYKERYIKNSFAEKHDINVDYVITND